MPSPTKRFGVVFGIAALLLVALLLFQVWRDIHSSDTTVASPVPPEADYREAHQAGGAPDSEAAPKDVAQLQPKVNETELLSEGETGGDISSGNGEVESSVVPIDEELMVSILEGEGTFIEKIRKMTSESRQRQGLPPPPDAKHQQQMDRVYAMIEQHGLPRQDLFEYYGPILRQAMEAPDGPFSTPKTHELYNLIRSSDWDAVDEFIEARLEENAYDLPALLIRFDLHRTQMKIEEMFEDVELLIPAIADLEPHGFDRRAILHYVLDRTEMIAYAGDEWLERHRERADDVLERGSAATRSLFLLRFLELEGLF